MKRHAITLVLLFIILFVGLSSAETNKRLVDGYTEYCEQSATQSGYETFSQVFIGNLVLYSGIPLDAIDSPIYFERYHINSFTNYENYMDWLEEKGYKIVAANDLGHMVFYHLMESKNNILLLEANLQNDPILTISDLDYSICNGLKSFCKPEGYRSVKKEMNPYHYEALTGKADHYSPSDNIKLSSLFRELELPVDDDIEDLYLEAFKTIVSNEERLVEYFEELNKRNFDLQLDYSQKIGNINSRILIFDQGQRSDKVLIRTMPSPQNNDLTQVLIYALRDCPQNLLDIAYDAYGINSRFDYRLIANRAIITNYNHKGDHNISDLELPYILDGYKVFGIDDDAFIGAQHLKTLTVGAHYTLLSDNAFRGLDQVVINMHESSAAHRLTTNCQHIRINVLPYQAVNEHTKETTTGEFSFQFLTNDTLRLTRIQPISLPGDSFTLPGVINGMSVKILGTLSCDFYKIVQPEEQKVIIDGVEYFTDTLTELPFENLIVPEGIVYIEEYAINYGGDILPNSTILLPSTLEFIETNAINAQGYPINVEIHEDNPYYTLENGFLIDKRDGTLVDYFGSIYQDEIIIPNYVRHIAAGIFSDDAFFRRVELPENLISIGDRAFKWCSNLEHIHLPKNLEKIGAEAFAQTALNEICLPDTLRSLGNGAFNQTFITYLEIPKSVEWLGTNPLWPYDNTPYNLIIRENNPYYFLQNNAVFDRRNSTLLFAIYPNNWEDYSIPLGTRNIAPKAFLGCQKLTNISLPEDLMGIGENALPSSLELLRLPDSLTYFGYHYPFENMKLLSWPSKSVYFPDGRLACYAGETGRPATFLSKYLHLKPGSADTYKFDGELFKLCNTVVVFDGELLWSEEGLYALNAQKEAILVKYFSEEFPLSENKDYLIPNTIEGYPIVEIADTARILLPVSGTYQLQAPLRKIGSHAFMIWNKCKVLLPEGLKSLNNQAFQIEDSCCFVFPKSLTQIGRKALNSNNQNASIIIYSFNETWTENEGWLVKPLNDPLKWVDDWLCYTTNEGTCSLVGFRGDPTEVLTIPNVLGGTPVTGIEDLALINLLSTKKLIIQAPMQKISDHAFISGSTLQFIDLPQGLLHVGYFAFDSIHENCFIVLPSSLNSIGDYAFGWSSSYGTFAVEEFTPAWNWIISNGGNLLDWRKNEDGSISITGCYNNHNITYLNIPGFISGFPVSSIKENAFINLTGCKELTLNAPIISIGTNAFDRSESLAVLNLPDTLQNIDYMAFHYVAVDVISLPNSLINIDDLAFGDKPVMDEYIFDAPAGSYAETWAKENGYQLTNDGTDPFDWLNTPQ
ncbi:MAG: leucine-rich repeat protein [Christensenellales bacterium]